MIGLLTFMSAAAFMTNALPSKIVLACYMQPTDLTMKDKNDPDKLFPVGPHRLLVFEFPEPVAGKTEGAAVKVYDPTSLLLGRAVDGVISNDKLMFGIMTKGAPGDVLGMVIGEPEAGKTNGRATLVRAEKDKPLSYMVVGRCGRFPTDDPDGAFEQWSKQAGTRE